MKRRSIIGLCVLIALCVAFFQAPAAWLAPLVRVASQGTVEMAHSWGTVWSGSSQLRIHRSSKESMLLAQPVAWEMDFSESHKLKAKVTLQSAALKTPVSLSFEGTQLVVAPGQYALPADSLNTLGAPFNTLKPSGNVSVTWPSVTLNWVKNVLVTPFSSLALTLNIAQLRSQLTGALNLGDYTFNATPKEAGRWALELITANPNSANLLLSGTGSVALNANGLLDTPQFELQAKAATPAAQTSLAALLNFLGRRQGDVYILKI